MDNLPGTDMLVDDYDKYNNDRQDVVDINADEAVEDVEAEPMADDYEAIKPRVLPEIPDQEVKSESYHTWHIDKWTNLGRKEHGPVFECGGAPWRVLFFPFGNNVDYASFYLEHGFDKEPPEGWYACVQFALVLWNPSDPSIYAHHTATHRFNSKEGDWGFTRFVELRRAFHQQWDNHERPLVENDEAKVTAYVRIFKDPTGVLWHNFEGYDSKKETGMVGLKNQGATCYLNSLLQSLYFTNAFRKAVYQIPTDSEAVKTNSAWTLQRLFYNLQKHKLAVPTSELTASFGWDSRQIFEQQDVQELSRILMEKLEDRMKGTSAENALPQLFVGKSKTYISCINVDFESSRIEDFWDIQLNVRGNKNLHESFMDYIQVETLEGENKYDAGEPYKLQDAKKGVIFESFPPVLHLHLKRFEYDINRDAMMKVNDRHEFPLEFDAAQYLSDDADRSESWVYQLHGVLVHSGDFNAGHYYAFLKPEKDGFFYKFDDDRVTRATMKETLEENFGGEYAANLANGGLGQRQPYMKGYSTKRSMNAYMLVYIRKTRLDQVLLGVEEDDIPSHIETKLAEERAELERRKKEREEAHFYLTVGLISDLTFKNHHAFDLVNWNAPPSDPAAAQQHRILRTTKISDFSRQVGEERGLAPEQVRFWVMVNRQNKTVRPDQPLRDPNMMIEEAWNKFGTKGAPFRLWAESCELEDGKPAWPDMNPVSTGGAPILVFLKYFDAQAQTLSGVGHVYVKGHAKVADIATQIQELMGWDTTTTFTLYEEIRHSMIEPMKPKQTFQQSEIQDGDIICFQKTIPGLDPTSVIYTDTRQYYDYLLNRISINFHPRVAGGTEMDVFTLPLSKKMTYEQFSTKVGDYLKVDPTHIRFGTVNSTTGKPKTWLKRTLNQNLQQIMSQSYSGYGYSNHKPDSLYCEILETSLADFETKKPMKVIWLSEGIIKEEPIELLVPKNGTIADLIAVLSKKVSLDPATTHILRVYEAQAGKVYKELADDLVIMGVNEYVTLYAEKIPEDELNATEDDRAIFCFHFDKEPTKPHGVPFKLVLKPGEMFKDTRERLSKRTGIKGKLLEKIKFAIVSRSLYTKPRYLEDDDVVMDLITDNDDLLGLDHVNKTKNFWNRGESIFIK